jgi:hypothetical protein
LQLINHKVNPSIVENMKIGVDQFFNLPIEEKKKLWQTPDDMQGFGQLFVVSDGQKLEWADLFYINTFPLYSRHPHLIPAISLPFRFTHFLNLHVFLILLFFTTNIWPTVPFNLVRWSVLTSSGSISFPIAVAGIKL